MRQRQSTYLPKSCERHKKMPESRLLPLKLLEKRRKVCYTFFMEKGLIITGKDFPESAAFVNTALANGFSAVVSVSEQNRDELPAKPVKGVVWQRSSSLSARSFVLEAQTSLNVLTHALVLFDTALYAKTGSAFTGGTQSLAQGIDNLIASYMYITHELIDRFKKIGGGTLCFVYKPYPDEAEYARMSSRLKETINPAPPLVSAAAEAFKSFAENTAAERYTFPIKFLLIEYASSSGREGDEETAEYLFSLPEMQNNAAAGNTGDKRSSPKNEKPPRWQHSGAKFSVVMNLFNR